jgi:formylglycine-generating enzyme required for sulfatase activity
MPEPKRALKVFLSYASQDRPVVRELSGRLASEGWIDPWVDEKKLLPGQDWRTKIEEAVETSDVVIVVLSSNSVTKEGFVQKELRYAREIAFEKPDETIFLIPLRLDDCSVPRGLRFFQWVDYFGEKKDESHSALIESLKLRYEQKLRLEEEERVRQEKMEQERRTAEERARKEAEEKARLEAEERAQQERQQRERKLAEVKARKEAEEKAHQDAEDRVRIEKEERTRRAAELVAKEKEKREIVEKAKREKAELETIEKAEREKAKHDAAEKSKHEREERQTAQIARFKEALSNFFTFFQQSLRKAVPFLRSVGIVGIIGALFLISSWAIPQLSSLFPTASDSVTQRPTPIITITPKPSKSPAVTSTLVEILTQTPSKPFTYVIQEGDTLPMIAEKFNLGNSGVLLLLEYNPAILENGGIYFVGQSLTIPPPGTILSTPTPIPSNLPRGTKLEYIVLPGDTLASIAAKFSSKEEDIIIANSIEDSNALSVGQVLQIPVNLVTPTATLPPTSTEITDAKGASMILVPAGEFTMGNDADNALEECQKYNNDCLIDWFIDEEPPHRVFLDSFYMDKYEVTYALYKACVRAGVCSNARYTIRSNDIGYANHPVDGVNWNDAKTYCEWRGARLPTEAEWEKAARGTDGGTYPWGEVLDCNKANFYNSITYSLCTEDDSEEVGSYESGKSPYGIYDLAGNVSEWVADWYSASYYLDLPKYNPLGPDSGVDHVLRGGSWSTGINESYWSDGWTLRSAERASTGPDTALLGIGFRCAMDANP